MYVCMYTFISMLTYVEDNTEPTYEILICSFELVCVYVFMYVWRRYVYICMYICTYKHLLHWHS